MGFFDPKHLLRPPVARAAYSDRTAWLMSKCAALAYERFEDDDGAGLKVQLANGGFQLVRPFNADGTQAYLASSAIFAVLAFRGTEKDFKDIRSDLDARFYGTEGGRMHRGFHAAYDPIADDVRAATEDLGNQPLYVTGHSLGGALATVAAWDLERDTLAACYTFGSPRVGDQDLDAALKAPVYRVVNAADIVPRVPFMAMGYRHVGDLRYLTRDGRLIRSASAFRTAGRFLWNVARSPRSVYRDHAIVDGYVAKLERYAVLRNPE